MGNLIRCSIKKRPNQIVFGRNFDRKLLDMFEILIVDIIGDPEEALKQIDLVQRNTTLFIGDLFETNDNLSKIRNYLTDFFGSNHQEKSIDVEYTINFIISVVAVDETTIDIHFGKYCNNVGKVLPIGLSMRLKIGRTSFANEDLFQKAIKQPKIEKKTKLRKVEEKTETGEHLARIHVKQQNLKSLHLKKIKKRFGRKENKE